MSRPHPVLRIAAVACMAAWITQPLFAAPADTAKDYPRKPIRLIAPFVAGAGSDTTARTIALKVSEHWDQQVVVDKVPRAIVAKLNAAMAVALKAPEVVKRLGADGSTPVGSSPEQFSAHVKSEIARWRKLVKDAGLSLK